MIPKKYRWLCERCGRAAVCIPDKWEPSYMPGCAVGIKYYVEQFCLRCPQPEICAGPGSVYSFSVDYSATDPRIKVTCTPIGHDGRPAEPLEFMF